MTFKWALMKKAIDYYYGGEVIIDKVKERSVSFMVDGHRVVFEKTSRYLKLLCDCEFCALHSVKDNGNKEIHTICSRKMACLLALAGRKGIIKEGDIL